MEPKITDPEAIRNHLLELVTPLPEPWQQYASVAERLGCRIHAVTQVDYLKIDIGSSPGGTWAFKDDLFISKSEDPECTVLHEICHWLVAKKHGLQSEVNFGATIHDNRIDDELETCDAQIVWVLVNRTPLEAWLVARWLQYDTTDETIRSTIESGCQQWASFDMPLEVSEELLQKLATQVRLGKTPDDMWMIPWDS